MRVLIKTYCQLMCVMFNVLHQKPHGPSFQLPYSSLRTIESKTIFLQKAFFNNSSKICSGWWLAVCDSQPRRVRRHIVWSVSRRATRYHNLIFPFSGARTHYYQTRSYLSQSVYFRFVCGQHAYLGVWANKSIVASSRGERKRRSRKSIFRSVFDFYAYD